MSWEYSKKTTELFMAAVSGKPGTHMGEIEDPDGFGEHGSIVCGDVLRFTFRVEKHPTDPRKDRIVEARYLTFGCTSAIASAEALCSLLEEGNYTPIEALKITNKDIVNYLEGLPQEKIHCSVMGQEALEAAVFYWARKRGVDLSELGLDITREEQEEGRLVCECFGITEPYLRRKIKELGLKTIPEITGAIKAGGACTRCHHRPGGLQDILDDIWGKSETSKASHELPLISLSVTPPDISPYRFGKLVEEAASSAEEKLGEGKIEVVDIKGALIYWSYSGSVDPAKVESTFWDEVAKRVPGEFKLIKV